MINSIEDFLARDLAGYKTDGERAAYRAGLGTATIICDAAAKRKRSGRIRDAVKECADAIWNIREAIKVRTESE